ncbi:MAG TPA: AAA family ATPase [Caldimonas sp.]
MSTMINASSPVSAKAPLKARFGRFEIDEGEARLLDDGVPVRLAPKPFAVLCALARAPHALVSKGALLDHVWGHQYVSESVLKTTISDVRAVLQDDAKQPRYIETVSCRGYRFIATASQPNAHAPLAQHATRSAGTSQPADPVAIGRSGELERLRKAWRAAQAGTRQVVWVAGEAGVGKTTLIERFMAEVGEDHCAHGHCDASFAEAEPGQPILEALTGLSRRDPEFARLMREVAPMWLAKLPWLCTPAEREALQRELAETGSGRMLREVAELLDRYSGRHPLLLVTEDLHWADQMTVELLDYLARRRTPARVMWLASFRLTEVIAAEHWLANVRHELRLHVLAREIVLDAFSPAEVAQYLAARMPALAGEPAFVDALYERTDGLPLFVAEVVDQLVASGAGAEGAAASMEHRLAAIPVPDTFAGIVRRYLDELTPKQRSILEAASVCGVQFRLSTLADVLQGELAPIASACAELARRQRWLRDGPAADAGAPDASYVFRHALYREVLYKRLDRLAVVELQRRVQASLDRERAQRSAPPRIVDIERGRRRSERAGRATSNGLPVPA